MHVETIGELIARLQRPGVDMFEQRLLRDTIARRGVAVIRDLLPMVPDDPPLLEGILLETLRAVGDPTERERARSVSCRHMSE